MRSKRVNLNSFIIHEILIDDTWCVLQVSKFIKFGWKVCCWIIRFGIDRKLISKKGYFSQLMKISTQRQISVTLNSILWNYQETWAKIVMDHFWTSFERFLLVTALKHVFKVWSIGCFGVKPTLILMLLKKKGITCLGIHNRIQTNYLAGKKRIKFLLLFLWCRKHDSFQRERLEREICWRRPGCGRCWSQILVCFYLMTQSQLVWSFESQGVSKILRACRNFGKVNG